MTRFSSHFIGSALAVASFTTLTAGCTSHPLETPDPTPQQETEFNELNPVRDLDVLFMIDNSASMGEEQTNLKANFPKFITKLRELPGGLPNVHIGIVNSDVGAGSTSISGNLACNRIGGDRGRLDPGSKAEGCGLIKGFRYLRAFDDEQTKNYTGDLATVFGCMANVGTVGCGFEHQLQSTKLALTPDFSPENAGFYRPDAFLAIIYITDEDDCSSLPSSELYAAGTDQFPAQTSNLRCALKGHVCDGKELPNGSEFMTPLAGCVAGPGGTSSRDLIPVQDFVDFLIGPNGIKRDHPKRVIVSGIVGWPANVAGTPYVIEKIMPRGASMPLLDLAPACTSKNGAAAPGLRLKSFIDKFGQNGSLHSICSDDFTPALERIATLIGEKLNPGCIDADLVDRDLTKNEVQPECQVADRVVLSGGQLKDTLVPQCEAVADHVPCWRIQSPAQQTTPKCDNDRFRVVVDRGAGVNPPQGVTQLVKCATCVKDKGISGCPCDGANACAFGHSCNGGSCAPDPVKP